MDCKPRPSTIQPRIIIHGGAGNITRQTLPQHKYREYKASLLNILSSSSSLLLQPDATALDVATHAVTLLENDPLFNSGYGAVFTRAGTNELEASIMVSNGYRKRGVGCMLLKHVKNPIRLARELLIKGEESSGDGAQDHCQYSGEFVEGLAKKWGLETVEQSYFWTQQRWEEHKRGLEEEQATTGRAGTPDAVTEMSDWEKENYIPLGTCGAVVLDSFGTICVATSTGGLTNKVPGRIGDTPSVGAGFWAEEWYEEGTTSELRMVYEPQLRVASSIDHLSRGHLRSLMGECIPGISSSKDTITTRSTHRLESDRATDKKRVRHAVGLSGTGNGDTFIRMAAARTVAAKSRFSQAPLYSALSWMSGSHGELQKSAGNRWRRTHEGTGGIIGIELVGDRGRVSFDYNCGGMFRAWVDEEGKQRFLVFREDNWEAGPSGWELE